MKKHHVLTFLIGLLVFSNNAFALNCAEKSAQLASYQSLITEYTAAKTDLENWLTPYMLYVKE